jgi:NitT/TauT family transport system permease protein
MTPSAQKASSALFLAAMLGGWELACRLFHVSPLIVPAPSLIAERAVELTTSGLIWPHLLATLSSVLAGFGLGSAAGLFVGGVISLLPVLERLVYPYVVALQTVPKIAIAPLFILWFGYGLMSKIVISALICFFPVLVSVMAGFHSTDRDRLEMMRAFGATRWQTLMRLRVPGALVMIFAGLEIATVLSVIGAVVGEFVGAQEGLGYLITALNFNMDVAGVFAVLIFLSLIGITLHAIVKFAGRRCAFWNRAADPLILA